MEKPQQARAPRALRAGEPSSEASLEYGGLPRRATYAPSIAIAPRLGTSIVLLMKRAARRSKTVKNAGQPTVLEIWVIMRYDVGRRNLGRRHCRGVAQWLARYVRDVEAGGSNPLTPTIPHLTNAIFFRAARWIRRPFLVWLNRAGGGWPRPRRRRFPRRPLP